MCEQGAKAVLLLKKPSGDSESVGVDLCIAQIVAALNRDGMRTLASCCGHDRVPGSIVLADGRELIIAKSAKLRHDITAAGLYRSGDLAEGGKTNGT